MAVSLKEIKERIESTQKTIQITNAMQMVSTSKLKKLEDRDIHMQEYIKKIDQIIERTHGLSRDNMFYKGNNSKRIGYLLVTTDKGLVGGYNNNVYKKFLESVNEIEKIKKEDLDVYIVGKFGVNYFNKSEYNVKDKKTDLHDVVSLFEVLNLLNKMIDSYKNNEIGEIKVIYYKYINSAVQNVKIDTIYPVEERFIEESIIEHEEDSILEINYNQDKDEYDQIDSILISYGIVQMFSKIVDSKTSEQALRKTAMKNATDNGKEIMDLLNIEYNRGRQAAITQELSEIIAGSQT